MADSVLHAAAYAGRAPDPHRPLFTETTVVAADDPRAAAVRRRILRRPIDPSRAGDRQVLLRYVDGTEHLLVSTVRAGEAVAPVPPWATFAGLPDPAEPSELVWRAEAALDQADVIAAAAVVLARYTGTSLVALGTENGAVEVDAADDAPRVRIRTSIRPATTVAAPAEVAVVCADPEVLDEWRSRPIAPIELSLRDRQLTLHTQAGVHPRAARAFLDAVTAVLTADEARPVGGVEIAAEPPAPTRLAVGDDESIVSAVLARSRERPDAVAVRCGSRTISYQRLSDEAYAVATRLAAVGVRRGDRVGVTVEPDESLIPVLLGVLMAGAAYVPLDPAYPRMRLAFMAEDAGVAAVIGPDGTVDTTAPVLPVRGPAEPAELPSIGAPDAAYVIYTSGSTGRPKGVLVAHRTVLNLLAATADFGFSEADVWTVFHSYAFDFSVWEIWGCLATGGRLVVVPRETARDPYAFHRLLIDEGVTVLNQTPSAFAQLSAVDGGECDSVRLLVFGGEPLDVSVLRSWLDRYPRQRVENMYGITETTVHCTRRTILPVDVALAGRSVGQALPGWSLCVRDAAGRVLPVGVPGEIYVEGAGVTHGYLGRPGLTAQRFTATAGGRRRYRSGDRGRLRPDGELEHLGRLDGQVKVRGHRIELGEVRAALLDQLGVAAAAVVVRRHDDDAFLAAYVVGPADPARLGQALANRLPVHYLPRTITPIDQLPTTVNGKLDVARLPGPTVATSATAPPGGDAGTPADGPLAWVLALWERLLRRPVGPDDNLFLIGGTSLLALKTALEARGAGFGEVTVKDVYRHPVARALAATLATGVQDASA
ncbi:non-ribosomal peptide synthetase [Micromonospora inyonensis]|uniref:Amino acid adenylation domain-containing protein n=1 Tax=Micromonospora inyonensis TaxID=47866 RepID=A0A1C6S782_9ACTN|nr:non-ribosomal peptide synthetase [Micromonospora inyonensis]SCL25330.1 amino acid adenylation domain-containing protein [Micromonospora inyonensis]